MLIGAILGIAAIVLALGFGLLSDLRLNGIHPGMGRRVYAAGLGVILLVIVASLARFEIVAAASANRTAMTFRIDRWTGDVAFCIPGNCSTIPWD